MQYSTLLLVMVGFVCLFTTTFGQHYLDNDYELALAAFGDNNFDYSMVTDGNDLTAPSLSIMQLHAKLSAASYCIKYDMQKLANWQCKTCKSTGISMSSSSVWEFAGSGLGVVVGYDTTNKVIRVIFRGSSNWANWAENLKVVQTTFNCGPTADACKVHSGFLDAWKSARSNVINKIEQLKNTYGSSTQLEISGHSLGGATAVVAFVDLTKSVFSVQYNEHGLAIVSSTMFPNPEVLTSEQASLLGFKQLTATYSVQKIITFGQPRVFNSPGMKYFFGIAGSKYTRVTHNHDLVPRVPIVAMGYVHAPNEVYFPDDTTSYKTCSTLDGEDKNCAAGNLISLSIKDHGFYTGVTITQDATSCS